jgi:hypothetical protein
MIIIKKIFIYGKTYSPFIIAPYLLAPTFVGLAKYLSKYA